MEASGRPDEDQRHDARRSRRPRGGKPGAYLAEPTENKRIRIIFQFG